jgi:glycosyltransferase involved in cell wall biosynthesis
MRPTVSVCLTTWNRAAMLPTTLESILGQDFDDFELIVSDDCSADDTPEACRSYEARDKRVRYYRNPEPLGMPGNLNAAIARARGRYIANLHDGDVFRRDLISQWKAALEAVPTAAFVFNAYRTVSENGAERVYREPFKTRVPGEQIALHYFETFSSCVWGTVMSRAEAYDRAGGFDPAYGFISDVEMWLRLAHAGDVAYVPEPLITLGPRPVDHPFRERLWQSVMWALAIYVKHLMTYRGKLPTAVEYYEARYLQKVRLHLLRTMFLCLKQRRWAQVGEGLVIWSDSPDPLLRVVGKACASPRWKPGWYDEQDWIKAAISR